MVSYLDIDKTKLKDPKYVREKLKEEVKVVDRFLNRMPSSIEDFGINPAIFDALTKLIDLADDEDLTKFGKYFKRSSYYG